MELMEFGSLLMGYGNVSSLTTNSPSTIINPYILETIVTNYGLCWLKKPTPRFMAAMRQSNQG